MLIAVPLVATRSFEPVSILDTGKLSGVPYGVLKISTEESKAWLDASDNTKLFAFATVVNEIILLELENIVGQFAQPT